MKRRKLRHTYKVSIRSLAIPIPVLLKLIAREFGKPKGWKPVKLVPDIIFDPLTDSVPSAILYQGSRGVFTNDD